MLAELRELQPDGATLSELTANLRMKPPDVVMALDRLAGQKKAEGYWNADLPRPRREYRAMSGDRS